MKLSPEEKKTLCDFFELLFSKMEEINSNKEKEKPDPKPEQQKNRLIPVSKWSDYHDWPSVGGLRSLIFNEGLNGFRSCIHRVGRRILIDEQAFFEWVKKNRSSDKSSHQSMFKRP